MEKASLNNAYANRYDHNPVNCLPETRIAHLISYH